MVKLNVLKRVTLPNGRTSDAAHLALNKGLKTANNRLQWVMD